MRIIIIGLLVFLSIQVSAQGSKIAHINTSELLLILPEVTTAKATLEKYKVELEGQVDVLVTEYRKLVEEYQALSKDVSTLIKTDKETQIVQLEDRIKKFQEEASSELAEKEKELLKPILDKVEAAIKEVAKEKSYDYVLDTAGGVVLFSTESNDITALVKKKLGVL